MDFQSTINEFFPGNLSLDSYLEKTYQILSSHGFTDENTFACVSACRDEIAKPLLDETDRVWGEVFNFSSLAGSLTLGQTGFAAAASHAPVIDGKERYIFIAMPHIAVSKKGEIGVVYREGREHASSACGALKAIIGEINSGKVSLQLDMDDLEQSVLKTKVIEKLEYGEKPDLVRITKVTHEIIKEDLEQLIKLSLKKREVPFDYAVLTGVMVHGPKESNYVYPQAFYSVSNGEKQSLELK